MTETSSPAAALLDNISSADPALSRQLASLVATQSSRNEARKHPPQANLKFQNDVAVLRAEGLTQAKTAKLMDVSTATIARVEKLPAVAQRIQDLRQIWESVAHEKITGISDKAWNLVEETIDAKDSKSFDQVMRAVGNMERVSASVAGVERKIEVTGMAPQVDVKAILFQLFGETKAAS